MELLFELRDHEDALHDEFKYKFNNQATLDELQEKIASKWKIRSDDQKLFIKDGQKLCAFGEDILQSLGVDHRCLVIAKHSLLSTWSAILDRESAFQQTHDQGLKKSIHEDAKRLIEDLAQARFFSTYPSLGTRRFAIEKKFLTFFDRKVEQIKNSCRIHFKKLYGEHAKITFESREDGSRAGCVCILDDGSTISRFYVKTHHGAGDRSSNSRYDIDLKELFVYTFLYKLKMGAEIHFINSEIFSRCIIYIASSEITGFNTLEFLEMNHPQALKEYTKFVNQVLLVYSVLMLGDHHTANIGFDCGFNPFIVDFFIIGKPMTSVKDLHEGVRMAKILNTMLGTFDERLKISIDYLKDSQFSVVFESAINSFLQNQKPVFDSVRFVFDKPQKTDDLEEYFANVRKNISLFVDFQPMKNKV
uniref:Ubiquitin-like domain-containing protein n=1 Tax=Caenorhabditis japonica TaxID=281687 RepID=A0A8R1DZW1_CAEJA